MPTFNALSRGDPAPWFKARSSANPTFAFDTVGGRYVVLCLTRSVADPAAQAAIAAAYASPVFDDVHASFFTVTRDPEDEAQARIAERYPGCRVFWDFDGAVSLLYGAAAEDDPSAHRTLWVVLDPTLRVIDAAPLQSAPVEARIAAIAALPPPARFAGANAFPPVLLLPNVFEPELCGALIEVYAKTGGEESGFMREQDGKTVLMLDRMHKRRRDCLLEDVALIRAAQGCVRRRIVPEIKKAFQFSVTRMERYLIGCYTAEDQGHFRPHRDNTTKGTAHRRFAVSINLNDDFEGGDLVFPEYGARLKLPVGGACVFSCSLLHAVLPVTRGARYAFLPFLYDDEAAALREQNNVHLAAGIGEYRKL